MGLYAGVLGMVEFVSVYVQVVFVGEVGFRYLLLCRLAGVLGRVLVQVCVELDRWHSTELCVLVLFCVGAY